MSTLFVLLLAAVACCGPLASAQSTDTGSIVVGYYYDVTAGRTLTGGPPNPHSLWCQPPQQYYNLPATGGTFSAFQTYVDLSQTNVCGSIRFGLYEVTGSLYTLVVGTNSSSDIQVCPSFVTGPSLVTTTAPLYYPSGSSSLTMSPTSTYSLCFSNEGDELTVPGTQRSGTIYMYYWQDAYTSLSTVNLNYYFDQPLPLLNPVVNQPTDWAFQVWMTATAPVISWSFAYSVQGQLTANSNSAFSVCTVGSILTALTPTATNASSYIIYQMYGTRTYSNGSITQISHIMSLGPMGADGSDALLYPTIFPYFDASGVTYTVNTSPLLPGGSSTPNTGSVLTPNPFVNVYNASGEAMEDGYDLLSKGFVTPMGIRVWMSNSTSAFDCSVLTAPVPSSSSTSSSSSSSSLSSSPSSSSPSSSSSSSSSLFSSSSSSSSPFSSTTSSPSPSSSPSSCSSPTSASSVESSGGIHVSSSILAIVSSSSSSSDEEVFIVASSSSSSVPDYSSSAAVYPSSASSSSSVSLSRGALAGVIIGVFVGAVLLAGLTALCLSSCMASERPVQKPAADIPPPYIANHQSSVEGDEGNVREGYQREGYAPTIVEMGARR